MFLSCVYLFIYFASHIRLELFSLINACIDVHVLKNDIVDFLGKTRISFSWGITSEIGESSIADMLKSTF